jgi:hypothetical protein
MSICSNVPGPHVQSFSLSTVVAPSKKDEFLSCLLKITNMSMETCSLIDQAITKAFPDFSKAPLVLFHWSQSEAKGVLMYRTYNDRNIVCEEFKEIWAGPCQYVNNYQRVEKVSANIFNGAVK